jgi:periplasmic divalent cation tolerance protein
MVPIRSVYRWQGAVERENEFLLNAKAPESGAEELVRRIRELHSYDVPEIVVTPIVGGNPDYLRWVADSCGPAETER